jgi:hypothetical protein
MKKTLPLLSLSFMLIMNSMTAQTYTPFPENVAVWDVYHRAGEPDPRYNEYARYIMKGDTVINAINYNKIYFVFYTYTYQTSSNTILLTMSKPGFAFGIRQDVQKKKVYRTVKVNNLTTDTLLYDYNLKIGDVVPVTYTTRPSSSVQTVTHIDSVTFHGKKYQRFNLSMGAGSGAALIEGVGNANGLIEYHDGFFEAGNVLSDFCNSDHADCSVPLALKIEEIDHADLLVNVYPNPFTDETTVSFSTEQPKRKGILYTILGKEVQTYDSSTKQLVIQKEGLKNGIYFLKIINGNNVVTKRLIIQ